MRRIVDKYHEAAKEKGVRIVHCCGFDSIPSDLGTCLVVDHLSRLGKYALHVLDGPRHCMKCRFLPRNILVYLQQSSLLHACSIEATVYAECPDEVCKRVQVQAESSLHHCAVPTLIYDSVTASVELSITLLRCYHTVPLQIL